MISTHILDTSKGLPASGVKVRLERKGADGIWSEINAGITNADGRFIFECEVALGVYQIIFEVEKYFIQESFFMNTPVVFKVENINRKFHVPLLLSPFGYSTYRGS